MTAPERPRIITIDGEPGAGKTTACTMVAERLGYQTLTSGMFYCATAAALTSQQISLEDINEPASIAGLIEFDLSKPGKPEVSVGGVDITGTVFSQTNKNNSARISRTPVLVDTFRQLVRRTTSTGEWVIDRGSEIFPDAELKIWLKASVVTRAARRCGQLALQGEFRPYELVLKDILEREARDRINPFINIRKPDEIEIDNTHSDEEQTFKIISNKIFGLKT
jgi:cytidylate kinase